MMKCYNIAGLTVVMDTYGRTLEQAASYQIEETKNVDIEIYSLRKAVKEKYPDLTDDDCEYIGTGSNFYKQLIGYDGLMLHSSAVVLDGKAYLFTADSGTGKSTHTQLWLERFGYRAYILNDDKPALRYEDGVWYAYGTPWSGKNDISINKRVPVAGIAVLERGENNEISPFYGISAVHAIIKQVNRPSAKEYREKLLKLVDVLVTSIPIWKLKCNMDPAAADVAYSAMNIERE